VGCRHAAGHLRRRSDDLRPHRLRSGQSCSIQGTPRTDIDNRAARPRTVNTRPRTPAPAADLRWDQRPRAYRRPASSPADQAYRAAGPRCHDPCAARSTATRRQAQPQPTQPPPQPVQPTHSSPARTGAGTHAKGRCVCPPRAGSCRLSCEKPESAAASQVELKSEGTSDTACLLRAASASNLRQPLADCPPARTRCHETLPGLGLRPAQRHPPESPSGFDAAGRISP